MLVTTRKKTGLYYSARNLAGEYRDIFPPESARSGWIFLEFSLLALSMGFF